MVVRDVEVLKQWAKYYNVAYYESGEAALADLRFETNTEGSI
jgi:hypothetical protein